LIGTRALFFCAFFPHYDLEYAVLARRTATLSLFGFPLFGVAYDVLSGFVFPKGLFYLLALHLPASCVFSFVRTALRARFCGFPNSRFRSAEKSFVVRFFSVLFISQRCSLFPWPLFPVNIDFSLSRFPPPLFVLSGFFPDVKHLSKATKFLDRWRVIFFRLHLAFVRTTVFLSVPTKDFPATPTAPWSGMPLSRSMEEVKVPPYSCLCFDFL